MALYSNIGNKYKNIEETLSDKSVKYDNNFSKRTMVQRYYKTFGYTAGAATVGGFLAGTHGLTDVIDSGLGALGAGTSKGSVGAFLTDTANTALRSPVISDPLNSIIESPNLLNVPESKIAPSQLLPGERFLSNSLGNKNTNAPSTIDTLVDSGKASLSTLITSVASTGTATVYDFTRAFENGLRATHIQQMSKLGLKYTQNVGFLDPTMPTWKKNEDEYTVDPITNENILKPKIEGTHTFDKYSSYLDNESSYDKLHPNTMDGTEMVRRYESAFGIKPKEHSTEDYIIQPIAPDLTNKNVEEKYGDIKSIKIKNENISPNQYLTRLGFPTSNFIISGESGTETIDSINALDVGKDYSENLRDSIKFMFEDITSGPTSVPIIFRATMTNLSDSISPSWNEIGFIGRADKFYTYTGFTRSVSFDFTVYVNSIREILPNWRKINRLYGMCYPVSYESKVAMKAPILKLTIGDMYSGVYGKLDSLTLAPHADSFWETEDGYQLPQVVTVSVSYTIMYEPSNALDENGKNINIAPIANSHHFIHNAQKFKSKFSEDLTTGL